MPRATTDRQTHCGATATASPNRLLISLNSYQAASSHLFRTQQISTLDQCRYLNPYTQRRSDLTESINRQFGDKGCVHDPKSISDRLLFVASQFKPTDVTCRPARESHAQSQDPTVSAHLNELTGSPRRCAQPISNRITNTANRT